MISYSFFLKFRNGGKEVAAEASAKSDLIQILVIATFSAGAGRCAFAGIRLLTFNGTA